MLKNIFLFPVLFLAVVATAAPAATTRISGVVSDQASGQAMEFVSVTLVNASQKIIGTTATNNKGEFVLPNVLPGTYTLRVSFMGYAEEQIPMKVPEGQEEIRMLPITLREEGLQLEGVTVSATKSMVEYDIDKTIINVADFISAEGSNAVDILRKIAGITVDEEGNISLNGQPASILLDGRNTNLSGRDLLNLLYFMDGTEIDKIEIIQNPSAKYDAAGGGGIINIRTKNSSLKGLSGSVQGTGGYYPAEGDYYNLNGGITLNYRNKWLNTVLNASARKNTGFSESESQAYLPHWFNSRQYNFNKASQENAGQSVRWNNSFYMGKKDVAGVVLSGMWSDSGSETDARSRLEFYSHETLDSVLTNLGESERKLDNYSANVNYQHIFKENVHDILLNFDYMNYITRPWSRYENVVHDLTGILRESAFTNNNYQHVTVLSAKFDYVRPLWKNARLEAGGKISETATDNDIVREEQLPSGAWVRNAAFSHAFRYKERIGALYASVGMQFNRQWSAKAGVRWENTWSRGNWETGRSDTATHQGYNDFFPTLYLGFTPTMAHAFSLSYAMRIQRPDYGSLNPFRSYSGDYSYSEGNPALQPQYTHSLNIGYTYDRFLNISLFGQQARQVITQESVTDTASGLTATSWTNFGTTRFAGATVSFSNIFVGFWWSFNFHLSGLYMESEAGPYKDSRLYATAYMENTFYFGKTWRGELTGYGQSPMTYGYYTTQARYSVSAGIRKNLWNHRATVSLYVDDLLDSQKSRVTTDYGGQRREITSRWSSRQLRLSFTYRFRDITQRRAATGNMEESSRL
jgi:outer membrane receptor protein involved in Fe transport